MHVAPTIETHHLSVRLGGHLVLDEVSLTFSAGELHAVIGPNGAGKTTLIRALLGGMPHTGRIHLTFRDKRQIGYVPQRMAFDRTTPMTVRDLLSLMLQRRSLFLGGGRRVRRLIGELLSKTQTAHLADAQVSSLSGGELQRVLLAQALFPQPELLLLDEPVSQVDEVGRESVERLLRELCDEVGVTVVMVGHQLSSIFRLVDRVTVLNRKVLISDEVAQVASSQIVKELFGWQVSEGGHARLRPAIGQG